MPCFQKNEWFMTGRLQVTDDFPCIHAVYILKQCEDSSSGSSYVTVDVYPFAAASRSKVREYFLLINVLHFPHSFLNVTSSSHLLGVACGADARPSEKPRDTESGSLLTLKLICTFVPSVKWEVKKLNFLRQPYS